MRLITSITLQNFHDKIFKKIHLQESAASTSKSIQENSFFVIATMSIHLWMSRKNCRHRADEWRKIEKLENLILLLIRKKLFIEPFWSLFLSKNAESKDFFWMFMLHLGYFCTPQQLYFYKILLFSF